MNMAPVLDVNSNPDNPVIGDRAFADPGLVAELGRRPSGGLRTTWWWRAGRHFPGHGDTSTDSHKVLPVVDAGLQRLRDGVSPFQQSDPVSVAISMTARSCIALDPDARPPCRPAVIQRLLRGKSSGMTASSLRTTWRCIRYRS